LKPNGWNERYPPLPKKFKMVSKEKGEKEKKELTKLIEE